MTDTFSAAKRSEIISLIKGSHNKMTEEKLLSLFREYGIIRSRMETLLADFGVF